MFKRKKEPLVEIDIEGDGPEQLAAFLDALKLSEFRECFERLGASLIEDLTFLTDEDLDTEVSLKLIQRRRLTAGLNEWKGQKKGKKKKKKERGRAVSSSSEISRGSIESPTAITVPPGGNTGDLLQLLEEQGGSTSTDAADAQLGFEEHDAPSPTLPPPRSGSFSLPNALEESTDDAPTVPATILEIAGESTDVNEVIGDLYEPMELDEGDALQAQQAAAEQPSADVQRPLPSVPEPGASADDEEDIDFEEDDMYESPEKVKKAPARTPSIMAEPEGPPPLPENPRDWLPSEVLRWLKDNGLEDFKDGFYANGFGGSQLLALNAHSFNTRGGLSAARCDALAEAIQNLRQSIGLGRRQTRSSPTREPAPPAREPAPPPKEAEKYARVLFEYEPSGPNAAGKLAIAPEEVLQVLDDSKAWWKVENGKGKQGLVPSNYLELCDAPAPPALPPPDPRRYTTNFGAQQRAPESRDRSQSALPLRDAAAEDISYEIWYHGNIDRAVVESKLQGFLPGTFLVRDSTSGAHRYTMCIKSKFEIVHLPIEGTPGNYALGKSDERHATIKDIVQYHRDHEIRIYGKDALFLLSPCEK